MSKNNIKSLKTLLNNDVFISFMAATADLIIRK